MQCTMAQQQAGQAFGVPLRAGNPPVVLHDTLRWLALRGLKTPHLFQTVAPADKRKLLALRHLYDTGRRPLRSKSCRDKDPHLIANLLLLWLGSLPEPLFPAALVPELVESQQSDYYDERLTAVRALLKRAEPHVVEALFPLFELLHHYWINQADRDSTLQELARLLAPAVFGTPTEHNLPAEDAGLLSDTVEMLISEYRPLFTQPFNLRRYEADVARQAAAAAQQAQQAAEAQQQQLAAAAAAAAAAVVGSPTVGSPLAVGSPLLTPIRCQRLSVMDPEGASPFSDCCATPLSDSPFSPFHHFLSGSCSTGPAAAMEGVCGSAAPFAFTAAACQQGSMFSASGITTGEEGSDQLLEEMFSGLLEETISCMLFDLPMPEVAADVASAGASMGAAAACLGSAAGVAGHGLESDGQPMSPTAVVREMAASDGGESCDGSDCDAPAAQEHPFAWPRSAPMSIPSC